jgi:arylsulfatase A-like enzyme
MTDQQRADCSAREGFPLDTTPFLDALARRGVWFNRAYTSTPVCAPARVSMLTGRYPSATRVRTNHNIPDAVFTQDLFDVFRDNGYATALVGKNHSHLTPGKADLWYECGHLGIDREDRSADDTAFDDFLKSTHFHLAMDPAPFPPERQIPHRLVNRAEEWVESVADRPFLLWLSFPEPHNPYQVPEPYYSMFPPETLPPPLAGEEALAMKGFKAEWCRHAFEAAFPGFAGSIPRARANYYGMLRLLDDQVRRFVDFLSGRGLADNTLVVFLSDHGDFVGQYGLMRKGAGLMECLTRIPLQFCGPGVVARHRPHPAHVSICDILPTLCEACGFALPDGVQGRSLWPLLTGASYPEEEFASAYCEHGFGGRFHRWDDAPDPRADGFRPAEGGQDGAYDCLNSRTQSGTIRMVRRGDWKLTMDMTGHGEMFDLEADPAEVHNLFDDPALLAKRAELLQDLLTWLLRVQDPLPLPRQRYVLKHDSRNYWTD